MVAKLSVQIALEGGKEIERQLEDISKAGQKVFNDINKAASKAGGFDKLDTGAVDNAIASAKLAGNEIDKVKKALADTARLEKLVQALSVVDGAFNKLGLSARALLLALGPLRAIVAVLAAVLGGGLVASANSAAAAISAVDAEAIKLGSSIGKIDKLRLGLEGAGLAAGTISSGLKSAFEAIEGANVAKAIKDVSDPGWGRTAGAAMKVLEKAAQGTGAAAERAREQLAKMGDVDAVGKIIEDIGNRSSDSATQIDLVVQKLLSMKEGAERTALAMRVFGDEAGPKVVQALRTGSLEQYIAAQRRQIAVTQEQANTANRLQEAQNRVATSWARFSSLTLAPGLTAGLNFMATSIDTIAAALATVDWAGWGATAVAALNAIAAPGAAIISGLTNLVTVIGSTAVAAWNAFSSAATSAINAVGSAITWVIDKINEAIKTLKSFVGMGGGGAAAGAPGFARGGYLGGRGTGTSDSNLAWVSRGEHIMPARAVRQPGVLALLEALRRSGGNLSGVLDRLGGFALGGMVGPMPAFAGGGVNSMSHVTIAFPGMAPIGGLRAPGSVVEELRRAAGMAQVRSGGRKPSRYG